MQKELSTLQNELAVQKGTAPAAPAVSQNAKSGSTAAQNVPPAVSSSASAATLEDIRERQAVQESQIATHEQTKVETESKYPVKMSGLLLFNSYVNTRQVDISANPDLCIAGVRAAPDFPCARPSWVLTREDRISSARPAMRDVRVDFFASGSQPSYAASGLLRLRTAHAGLEVAEYGSLRRTGPQFSCAVHTILARSRLAAAIFLERKFMVLESADRPLSPDRQRRLEAMEHPGRIDRCSGSSVAWRASEHLNRLTRGAQPLARHRSTYCIWLRPG